MKGEEGTTLFRASLRIITFGLILFLLVLPMACLGEQDTGVPGIISNSAEDEGKTGVVNGEPVSIADIISNPDEYEGKTLTLSGEYLGWEPGYGSPPVTRSDWIIKDETGGIYVTTQTSPGLDPVEDRGKEITVHGVVRVKDGQSYIEAKIVKGDTG